MGQKELNFDKESLEKLCLFEFEDFPFILVENLIPLSAIGENFPSFAEMILNNDGRNIFTKEKFSVTKHAFVFKEGEPYYVIVCHFPFRKKAIFSGFVKRVYIVFSEKLQKTYVFLEVLREKINRFGKVFYYDIFNVCVEGSELVTRSMVEYDMVEEDQLAENCCTWAYMIEKKRVYGFKQFLVG